MRPMKFDDEVVNLVYNRNEGYCEYCGKKLAFRNYGKYGEKGAWHIEHSNPKAKGGTDYLRNLVAACIDCNLDKGTLNGAYYRKKFEPETLGGQLAKFLGLGDGFLGASRRKRFTG